MARLIDEIVVYGDPNIKASEWYNAVSSELLRDGGFSTTDRLVDFLYPIADYTAALIFEAWARASDVDIEPALQEKIDSGKLNPVKDTPLFKNDGIDRNAEDNIFEADSSLSTFLAKIADRAITHRYMESNGYNNPVIWMFGEKGPGSRPEFKETAYDLYIGCFIEEMWFVFEKLLKGGEWYCAEMPEGYSQF